MHAKAAAEQSACAHAGVEYIYVVQHTARVEYCARRLLWVVN
jgi:hypothetical protein